MTGIDDLNRYLFHWLSPDALEKFDAAGKLEPSWRHWLLDEGRHVRGTSTCEEPMLWSPDEEKEREPCLVIDRKTLGCPVHAIDSAQAFHLTREIARAKRGKRDIPAVIERAKAASKFTHSAPDEHFVEGKIAWDSVVAIGFECLGTPACDDMRARAEAVAARRGIPMIDMTGWEVSRPGYRETDEIVDEARSAALGAASRI